MKKFYVCDFESSSGIARYAEAFYRLVLEPRGYLHIPPAHVPEVMVGSDFLCDKWHVELGSRQISEKQAFILLVDSGCINIDITVHDPPLLAFPWFDFSGAIANKISKGFDWYCGSFGVQTWYLKKASRVFVLTHKGADSILRMHGKIPVSIIPHIVDPSDIWVSSEECGNDILFFGFIGPSKGLDYALQLHAEILKTCPDIRFHVVGKPVGLKEEAYLDGLLKRFPIGVTYHGYLDERSLDMVFSKCAHVFLPFTKYRYFIPASGSILNALRRGRILWTTNVNTIGEVVTDGENGMFLKGDLHQDLQAFIALYADTERQLQIKSAAVNVAHQYSLYPFGNHF